MVIKTLSKKAEKISFKSIIDYIDRQDKRTAAAQLFDPNFRIVFNLQGVEKNEVISEFQENFEKYKPNRKNGVGVYHEILSFKKEDSLNLSQEVIEDLAYTYLEKRTPKGMCYGAVHTDRDHIHLHLVISANELKSKKANRLTQDEFLEVRRYIEEYQKEKYPKILSIVYDDLKLKKELRQEQDRNTRREKLYKVETRGKSQKEIMTDLFVEAIVTTPGAKEFYDMVLGDGRKLYVYRDKVNGIVHDGRKYRFTTLIKAIKDEQEKEKCTRKLETFRRLELLKEVRQKEFTKDLDIGDDLELSL